MTIRPRVATIAVAVILVACTPSDTVDCSQPSVTLDITVTDSAMDPSEVAVCRDQAVTLSVVSETDAIFHIHGYDDQVPATPLEVGGATIIEFTADIPGQFIIELHERSGQDAAEIGVLTVNEP